VGENHGLLQALLLGARDDLPDQFGAQSPSLKIRMNRQRAQKTMLPIRFHPDTPDDLSIFARHKEVLNLLSNAMSRKPNFSQQSPDRLRVRRAGWFNRNGLNHKLSRKNSPPRSQRTQSSVEFFPIFLGALRALGGFDWPTGIRACGP
jgi:hypothetical protein